MLGLCLFNSSTKSSIPSLLITSTKPTKSKPCKSFAVWTISFSDAPSLKMLKLAMYLSFVELEAKLEIDKVKNNINTIINDNFLSFFSKL